MSSIPCWATDDGSLLYTEDQPIVAADMEVSVDLLCPVPDVVSYGFCPSSSVPLPPSLHAVFLHIATLYLIPLILYQRSDTL